MASYYLENGMSAQALEHFFAQNAQLHNTMQGVVVWKNGRVVAKAAPAPYCVTDKGELYSLSKSFCSTAVGMLIDEGRLQLSDKLADLFPAESRGGDPRLCQATVEDLLTMRTGHPSCVMPRIARSVDPIRAFFRQPTQYTPGTHFAYNTAATWMLSAILQKITGMTVADYLEPRLFAPLGITGQRWNSCAGVTEGGIGLHVSADDIWKLGVLYLQKGVWEGKRLLSEQWVDNATAPHADNSMNGSPDWCAGYGFQFWNNAGDGYRGDGAFGQLCMVLPEKNAVVAVRALVSDMQREVELVQELAEQIDASASEPSPQGIEGFAPLQGGSCPFTGLYACRTNPFGWTQLRIAEESGLLTLSFSDGISWQTMRFGANTWEDSSFIASRYCPKLVELQDNAYPEPISFAGSWEEAAEGVRMLCRYRSTPHVEEILLSATEDGIRLQITPEHLRAKGASLLTAVKIGGDRS